MKNEFKALKAEIRRGVKPPWYEIKAIGKDGKEIKLVAKIVDKFLSDEWDKEEM